MWRSAACTAAPPARTAAHLTTAGGPSMCGRHSTRAGTAAPQVRTATRRQHREDGACGAGVEAGAQGAQTGKRRGPVRSRTDARARPGRRAARRPHLAGVGFGRVGKPGHAVTASGGAPRKPRCVSAAPKRGGSRCAPAPGASGAPLPLTPRLASMSTSPRPICGGTSACGDAPRAGTAGDGGGAAGTARTAGAGGGRAAARNTLSCGQGESARAAIQAGALLQQGGNNCV